MTQNAAQRARFCGRWQECFRRRRGCGDRGSLFSLGFRFVLFDAARRGARKDCTHLRVGQPSNRLGQAFTRSVQRIRLAVRTSRNWPPRSMNEPRYGRAVTATPEPPLQEGHRTSRSRCLFTRLICHLCHPGAERDAWNVRTGLLACHFAASNKPRFCQRLRFDDA